VGGGLLGFPGGDSRLSLSAMLVVVFERFTDRARRVMVFAQEEARLLNHNFIGTEHLLLGLIQEGEGVAAHALESLGVTLGAARSKVAESVGPAGTGSVGSAPFTPRTKKVLELSLREALQLGHKYIGTEHLLLGLVREGEGGAAHVLQSLGADLPAVRRQVMAALERHISPGAEVSWMSSEENRDGPRCPWCRSLLDGHVNYRVLSVRPSKQDEATEAIDVRFVYCARCGVVVAHTAQP
jgi:ATP-dependent Clp protease ATP-binding subunit ClpA